MIDEKKLIERLRRCVDVSDNSNFTNGILSAIDVVNRQAKTDGWIPCSKRLPENPEDGLVDMDELPEYIVTIDGAVESTVLKYAGDGEWLGGGAFYRVIAWKPLPEAYHEKGMEARV